MGLLDKIRAGLSKTKRAMNERLTETIDAFEEDSDEFYDDLEETLILSDVGAEASMQAVEELREVVRERRLKSPSEVKGALKEILVRMLGRNNKMMLYSLPSVILVVGVNGVGKTTTIGKLSAVLRDEGKKVLLAAGDTFRAAAAEQLSVWAQRSGADFVRHEEGSDPAAVVFDSISAAKARNVDVIVVDTAGRLHNKSNLMNELNKISRVIDRELPDADRETLLVLDATTGQNGLTQAEEFKKFANLTGIVLTKLDGTAKGGIVFAIAEKLRVPVRYIGVGEQMDDLIPFNAEAFVEELLG